MSTVLQVLLYVFAGFGLLVAILAVVLPSPTKAPPEVEVKPKGKPEPKTPKAKSPLTITNLHYLPRNEPEPDEQDNLTLGA